VRRRRFHSPDKKATAGILLAAVSLAATIVFHVPGPGKTLSLKVLDLMFQNLPGPGPHPDILIVTVDQPDIDFFKNQGIVWPWPRQLYASLIDFCQAGNARGIVFDILFTEPSTYGPEDDETFARSAAGFGRVYFPFFLSKTRPETEDDASPFPSKAGITMENAPPCPSPYPSVILPIQGLVEASGGMGNVSARPDTDGIFRRIRPVYCFQKYWVPALALSPLTASPGFPWRWERRSLVQESLRIPLDAGGNTLLRFRGPSGTHPRLSAANIIRSEFQRLNGVPPIHSAEIVRDKWVLVGLTAPGLMDLKAAPTGAVYSGVEIHATFLDNLLAGDFLKPVPAVLSWVLTGITALGVIAVVFRVSGFWATLAVPFLFALLNGGIAAAAFMHGWWADPVLPFTALAGAFGLAVAYSYATEGQQKKAIRHMFGHYLSESVIGHLLADPHRLQLGGERRRLTLFFSDLAGFTTLSERLEPEAVVSLLNQYLSVMTEIILEEAGTVDKFEGDAIMAFWGAPLDQPFQAVSACRTALRQQAAMEILNGGFADQNLPKLSMRIGIHTGEAVVGNLGSEKRFDFTVIGDTVNLASRLESLNKLYGTEILVSETTVQGCGDAVLFMEIDRVAVKGRTAPITVYTPLALKETLADGLLALREAYAEALGLYRRSQFEAAAARFEAISRKWPHAGPAAILFNRCRRFLETSVSEDWDAVFRPDQK